MADADHRRLGGGPRISHNNGTQSGDSSRADGSSADQSGKPLGPLSEQECARYWIEG